MNARNPMTRNERYNVTDAEPFALVDYTNSAHGFAMFSFFGPVNRHGYRGCGCQAIPNDQLHANIDAVLKQGRYRLFDQRTAKEVRA